MLDAVQYLAQTPSPPLDRFIVCLWCCADAPPHSRERVLPGGSVDLVFNLVEDEARIYDLANQGSVRVCSGALVRGTATRSVLIDPRQRASLVGVHFRPGGAFPFLGVSPSEIVDAHLALHDLWGHASRSLREQLLEAGSPSERFGVVEAARLQRLRRARPGRPAVRAALAAFRASEHDVRVAEVAASVGLSHRGFIEAFKTEVGLTPKLYARLQRFHRAKERIAALGAPPSWATFAIDCGYFDQAHMIRDFVGFSGISPTSYLRSRTGETMFDHLVHDYHARRTASRQEQRARSQ